MAPLSRRHQHRADIWPGFVDALATLLMVIIFLLMIFVIAQFFLNDALSGRDQALDRLRGQVSELADLLNLERQANADLRANIAQLSDELQASVATRDDLALKIRDTIIRAETAEKKVLKIQTDLDASLANIQADREKIGAQLAQITALTNETEALKALREQLEIRLRSLISQVAEKDEEIITEKKLSETAQARVALLNQQIKALRVQISKSLKPSRSRNGLLNNKKSKLRIWARLNAALQAKFRTVTHRSEFLAVARCIGQPARHPDRGDRLSFSRRFYFQRGSDRLGTAGRIQIEQLQERLKL